MNGAVGTDRRTIRRLLARTHLDAAEGPFAVAADASSLGPGSALAIPGLAWLDEIRTGLVKLWLPRAIRTACAAVDPCQLTAAVRTLNVGASGTLDHLQLPDCRHDTQPRLLFGCTGPWPLLLLFANLRAEYLNVVYDMPCPNIHSGDMPPFCSGSIPPGSVACWLLMSHQLPGCAPAIRAPRRGGWCQHQALGMAA